MPRPTSEATALPPDRAFVIQLREGDQPAPESLCGRVEHIRSGRMLSFSSLDQLLDFMSETINKEGK